MINNKKIKIHVKNNHWASGSFPTDAEGEKNFTITKAHFDKALENEPEVKNRLEVFIDWNEDNFNSSMATSQILLTWDLPTKNIDKIAPNLKWIHCIGTGMHWWPTDKASLIYNFADPEDFKPFVNRLTDRRDDWKKAVKSCRTPYMFLKENFYNE